MASEQNAKNIPENTETWESCEHMQINATTSHSNMLLVVMWITE